MAALVSQMVFWLVAAIILGFLIGWFFSNTRENIKYGKALQEAGLEISKQKEELEKFEQIFQNQEKQLESLVEEYKNSKIALSDKNILLAKMKERLERAKKIQEESSLNFNNKQSVDEGINMEISKELEALKELNRKKQQELEEFEKVLIKAEETIESTNEKVVELEKKIELISLENKNYKERITEVENRLKLYESNKKDEEFLISKDQFVQIEEQLLKYQEEIDSLKKINDECMAKIEKNLNLKTETPKVKVEKIVKGQDKKAINLKNRNAADAIKDGAVVNIFKGTYKKITKS